MSHEAATAGRAGNASPRTAPRTAPPAGLTNLLRRSAALRTPAPSRLPRTCRPYYHQHRRQTNIRPETLACAFGRLVWTGDAQMRRAAPRPQARQLARHAQLPAADHGLRSRAGVEAGQRAGDAGGGGASRGDDRVRGHAMVPVPRAVAGAAHTVHRCNRPMERRLHFRRATHAPPPLPGQVVRASGPGHPRRAGNAGLRG
mmetsp:Transcript_34652/g.92205  ORF Transcript_34652/g.92205 Transcript_34652/m.92205 type:complete len:201 (+) Transcript_34652:507-1109(+)